MNKDNEKITYINTGLALGTITWIVFMILGYGFGGQTGSTGFSAFLFQNQFWIWFPLWIGPAVLILIMLIALIVGGILTFKDHIAKSKRRKEAIKQAEIKKAEKQKQEEIERLKRQQEEEYIKNNFDFNLRLPAVQGLVFKNIILLFVNGFTRLVMLLVQLYTLMLKRFLLV